MKMNNSAVINTCDWGSTGKIAKGLQSFLQKKGCKTIFCYGRGARCDNESRYRFCHPFEVKFHYIDKQLTGRLNASSVASTRRLIARLRAEEVKKIYIVNLHGYILNEKLFFDYIAHDDIHVVYIMADESAFLGNCTYRNGCDEYKKGCKECKVIKGIAKVICPNASKNAYLVKKNAYNKINHITFVGPEFVVLTAKTSPLLEGKRIEIVDEAVDVQVNVPKETTRLRKELGIRDDQIVIGCVAPFSYPRKGVRFLVEAAKRLEHNSKFVFVQVGFDVNNKSGLPKNYIPVGYVNGQELLTEYYSLADLFVYPSLEDTMPNACLEALSCGSPLLCFNTSGMPYIADDTVMTLVDSENIGQMVEVILNTNKKNQETIDVCRNYALKRFDNKKYSERLLEIMNSMN